MKTRGRQKSVAAQMEQRLRVCVFCGDRLANLSSEAMRDHVAACRIKNPKAEHVTIPATGFFRNATRY